MRMQSDVILLEELIKLSTNEELKVHFSLLKDIPVAYPTLCRRKFLIVSSSSYLVKTGYSAVANLTTKRNRLQIVGRGDLRLYLTNLKPNIEHLLPKHQAHPSY